MQKRNSIFMLAYITFIIFSIVLRCFIDYELWGPIVLAITISSIFFAFEDFLRSVQRSLSALCEIADSFISKARDKTNQDLILISNLIEKAEKYSNSKIDIKNVIQVNENRKQLIECAISEVDKIEGINNKRHITLRNCGVASNWLAFGGFLSLFCVLILSSLFVVSDLLQEIMTVATFVVILFTQYLNDVVSKNIKRTASNSENALKKYEEAQKSLQKMEKDFDNLIKVVEDLEELYKKQEEIDIELSKSQSDNT